MRGRPPRLSACTFPCCTLCSPQPAPGTPTCCSPEPAQRAHRVRAYGGGGSGRRCRQRRASVLAVCVFRDVPNSLMSGTLTRHPTVTDLAQVQGPVLEVCTHRRAAEPVGGGRLLLHGHLGHLLLSSPAAEPAPQKQRHKGSRLAAVPQQPAAACQPSTALPSQKQCSGAAVRPLAPAALAAHTAAGAVHGAEPGAAGRQRHAT